jgi:hypothetical protein
MGVPNAVSLPSEACTWAARHREMTDMGNYVLSHGRTSNRIRGILAAMMGIRLGWCVDVGVVTGFTITQTESAIRKMIPKSSV